REPSRLRAVPGEYRDQGRPQPADGPPAPDPSGRKGPRQVWGPWSVSRPRQVGGPWWVWWRHDPSPDAAYPVRQGDWPVEPRVVCAGAPQVRGARAGGRRHEREGDG